MTRARKGRGTIRQRGKSSWELKFDVGTVEGKRQTRYFTFRGTRREADAKLTELLDQANKGTLPEPNAQTVQEYRAQWLRTAHEQSPKTLERYGELASRQIYPHLGSIKLRDLRAEQVRAWHSTLIGEGLAPRTIGHAHRLLRLALEPEVRKDALSRYGPPKVEDEELEILTAEEAKAVLTALEGHDLYPIVSLAIATGMRRGELLALQWGDVDLDKATLRVERAVEETKSGLRLKSPKTKRGRRSISLPPDTVALLRYLKVSQMELRLAIAAGKLEDGSLVFGNLEGKLRSPRAVSRAWRRFVAAKELPRAVTFHALRHTHVSMLIRAGVDILTISRRIGHSNPSVTLDVYGHLMEGADAAAADAIAGVLK